MTQLTQFQIRSRTIKQQRVIQRPVLFLYWHDFGRSVDGLDRQGFYALCVETQCLPESPRFKIFIALIFEV